MAFKLDFGKLNDPVAQEQARQQRALEAQQAAEHDKKLRGWLDTAFDHYEQLSERERDFIRSCRHRLNTFLHLTGPQESWLGDIAAKFTN